MDTRITQFDRAKVLFENIKEFGEDEFKIKLK